MKKFFCLIILAVYSSDLPSYPFYYYDQKKIRTSSGHFRRYIHPQLKSVVQEFYHILRKIDKIQNNLINIRTNIQQTKRGWNNWVRNCHHQTPTCQKALDNIYLGLRKLDLKISELQSFKLKTKKKDNRHIYKNEKVDLFLDLVRVTDQLSILGHSGLHQLENFLLNNNISFHSRNSLSNSFHKMLFFSEMLITGQLEQKYRSHFELVFTHFIKDIDKYIVMEKNQKFLLDNLRNLNIVWNSFHMRVTKGHIKLPGKTKQTISVMHNRWNSILKFYLKNTRFL